MKKIEATINSSRIEEVKNALTKIGIRRMKISRIDLVGSQQGHKEIYKADEYIIDVVKEFKIELIVTTDRMLRQVVQTIKKTTKTERAGEEEIFVSPVEEVIPV
jgi:nitrogen regulatory protein P-II 1